MHIPSGPISTTTIHITLLHWRHVIFSDESRVTLDAFDGRLWMRCRVRQLIQDVDILLMRKGHVVVLYTSGVLFIMVVNPD